ncbi:GNAT family N-acetyltransferase [Rhodococcus phenolicus]|uniref:GNAT family N-acetyltransferase n=1 Tax=Rhodococcus phenolicus TaxID=263849 RepID=UPI0009EED1DD|nr:GNAT family N-acetyltransferase [Rhodococcus phenolicus]
MLIEPRSLDDPAVLELLGELQLEYVHRYGGQADNALLPDEFVAPRGTFLLACDDGCPVGIGGWRTLDSSYPGIRADDAEIKRMYVRDTTRRRGFARRILGALERTATDAGRRRTVLETGTAQPEAIALYESCGYTPMSERYGRYAYTDFARYYSKLLPPLRLATSSDLPLLQDIERAAGAPFADLGMTAVADDEPPSIEELQHYCDAGRAWVHLDSENRPDGYLLADVVDGNAHVEQVSVHPDHARAGIGRMLLEHAVRWARDHGHDAMTLTTYVDVPWNGPYYARLGFRVVDDAHLTPELREIRAAEARHGLDRWPRAAMRREL